MGINSEGLFTILGAVIAGVIGLGSSLYVLKVQWGRQQLERTCDKIEDLSTTIESLRHDFWELPTYAWEKHGQKWLLLPVMDPTIHIVKVNMSINLYAPKLKDQMMELEGEMEKFRKNSELHQKWNAVEAIHSICDGMQKELVALSKQALAK